MVFRGSEPRPLKYKTGSRYACLAALLRVIILLLGAPHFFLMTQTRRNHHLSGFQAQPDIPSSFSERRIVYD